MPRLIWNRLYRLLVLAVNLALLLNLVLPAFSFSATARAETQPSQSVTQSNRVATERVRADGNVTANVPYAQRAPAPPAGQNERPALDYFLREWRTPFGYNAADNCGAQVGAPTGQFGRSINSRTGGEDHHVTDLSFPGLCGRLAFTRYYSSLATNIYTTTLGYGWTHSLDTRLILPTQAGGVPGQVLFKFQNANQLIFFDHGSGVYAPYPGILAALAATTSPAGFKITLPDQRVYLFDANGRLLSMRDAQNHTRTYIYTNDLLTRVADDSTVPSEGQRFLNLAYDAQNRLQRVSDPLGRAVEFGYDANGDLTTALDARGKTWTYRYDAHRLTEYLNPLNQTVMRLEYNAQGRAVREFDGLGYKTIEIAYNTTDGLDGTRVITDAVGSITTATYDWRGTLVGLQDNAGATQKTYDANFRPSRVTDPNNRVTKLTWSNNGRNLTRLVDARGMTTTLAYDSSNNLTQTLDVLGRANTFEYQAQLLKRSSDALNHTTIYTYTVEGFLQAVTDARGNTTSYTYNPFGQRTSMTDALGHPTTYEYDAVGRLTKTTDALGRVTRSEYDNADHLIRVTQNYRTDKGINEDNQYNIITEYGYDDAGRRTTMTDALGRVTLNEYNANGQLVQVTQNYRAGFAQNAQNEYNLVTTYAYDAQGRQTQVTDTLGRVTRNAYDSANRLFQTTQNYLAGQPRNHQNQYNIITEYGYDAAGNVLSTTDTFGRMMVTLYDELNRPIRSIVNYQDGVYDGGQPDQDLIAATTYDAVGNVATTTDELGRVTLHAYDALNRLTRVTVNYLAGQPQNHENQYNLVTEYVYNAVGARTRVIDTLGRITRTEYDAVNRAFRVTENLQGAQPQNHLDEYNFFTTFTFDDVGNRVRVTDTLGRFSQTEYDGLNRVTAQIDAANGRTSFAYDALGNRVAVTDAQNKQTTFAYDTLNRLRQITRPLNTITRHEYDALGNRTRVIDARNNPTDFGYDALNRNTTITDALNQTTQRNYDALGRVTQVIDPLGHRASFGYDLADRQISARDDLGNLTRYTYDGLGNRKRMIDAKGIITRYLYDQVNRLKSVTENFVAGGATNSETNVLTQYAYDALGNRTRVIDANARDTIYTYDTLNRLKTERNALGHTTTFSYDAVKRKTSNVDAKGQTTQYGYDALDRLTNINYLADNNSVQFGYDAVGNRTHITDTLGVTNFVYDDLYRVSQVTDPFNQTVGYGYDPNGNRTRLVYPDTKPVDYTYNALNQLATVQDWMNGTTSYEYDAARRLTTLNLPNGAQTTYQYDNANRLTQTQNKNGTNTLFRVNYTLDAVGNRVRQDEISAPVGSSGVSDAMAPSRREGKTPGAKKTERAKKTRQAQHTPGAKKTRAALETQQAKETAKAQRTPGATKTARAEETRAAETRQALTATAAPTLTPTETAKKRRTRTATPQSSEIRANLQHVAERIGANAARGDLESNAPLAAPTNTRTPTRTPSNTPLPIVVIDSIWTADTNNTPKTLFQPGETIRYRALLKNYTGAAQTVVVVFDIVGPCGFRRVINMNVSVPTNGTTVSNQPLQLPLCPGGHTYTLTMTWNGTPSSLATTFVVNGPTVTPTSATVSLDSVWTKNINFVPTTTFNVGDDIVYSRRITNGTGSNQTVTLATRVTGPCGIIFEQTVSATVPPGVRDDDFPSSLTGVCSGSYTYTMTLTWSGNSITRSASFLVTGPTPTASLTPTPTYTPSPTTAGSPSPTRTPSNTPRPPGVWLNRVWTTDQNAVNRSVFQVGDPIRYYVEIYNNTLDPQTSSHQWQVTGPCGTIVNQTFSATEQTGVWYWYWPSTLTNVCLGEYTYTFTLTWNSVPVALSIPFTVNPGVPTLSPTPSGTPAGTPTPTSSDPEVQLIEQTNYHRQQNGCQPVVANEALMAAAQRHSDDMAANDFFSHAGSDGSGPDDRALEAGYSSAYVGENIFATSSSGSPLLVISAWMASDGHRGNMLNCHWREVGVGYAPSSISIFTHFWTQVLGKPGVIYTPTPTRTLTPTNIPLPTDAPTATPVPTITPTPTAVVASEYRTTIDYAYDPLYRLKGANYTGAYTSTFGYAYDSVGNRLTQTIDGATTNYVYDNANRLTSVNGQAHTWDNNGNLLSDGVNTYAYDQANRLITVNGQTSNSVFAYNGAGDRLRQTVGGVTTNYALDLNAGLTQVLADGTNTYLYGSGRIAQYDTVMQYFGADGLGSVRQIYNAAGVVRRNTRYDPFGNVQTTNGTAASVYGFTGEQTDGTGLVYLRARYYAPQQGRFFSHDPWGGTSLIPSTQHFYLYGLNNPILYTDPSGQCIGLLSDLARSWDFTKQSCENYDNALHIVQNDKVDLGTRALAGTVVLGTWVGYGGLQVGGALLGGHAVGAIAGPVAGACATGGTLGVVGQGFADEVTGPSDWTAYAGNAIGGCITGGAAHGISRGVSRIAPRLGKFAGLTSGVGNVFAAAGGGAASNFAKQTLDNLFDDCLDDFSYDTQQIWGEAFAWGVSAGLVEGAGWGLRFAGRWLQSRLASAFVRAPTMTYVSPKDLATIERHLAENVDPATYNDMMIKRLRDALNSGKSISGADENFYRHELREAELRKIGLSQEDAHMQTLQEQKISPYHLYHPDVIKEFPEEFNDEWFKSWGIEPPTRK